MQSWVMPYRENDSKLSNLDIPTMDMPPLFLHKQNQVQEKDSIQLKPKNPKLFQI